MAEPLKNMYSPAFFEKLCPVLEQIIPSFNSRDFTQRVFDKGWPDLELKERVRHIALALHHHLPKDFTKAAKVMVRLSQALRKRDDIGEQGFATIFIPDYIEVFGTEHPDEALTALEEITKLVSAEFAIRPFLLRYSDKTMHKMLQWSSHGEANVREGFQARAADHDFHGQWLKI